MADTTIASSVSIDHAGKISQCVAQTSKDNHYFFYQPDSTSISYQKSTDGGATWGGAVSVYSGDTVKHFTICADWWTPGDLGTKIHIVYMARSAGSTREHRSLNTDGDSLSTAVSWGSGGVGVASPSNWTAFGISLTKSRAARLHIHMWQDNGASDQQHHVSDDEGATWTAKTDVAETVNPDKTLMLSGNEESFDDIWMIYLTDAAVLKLKVYNFGSDSWTSFTVATLTEESDDHFQFSACMRHSDNHAIVIATEGDGGVDEDLKVWDITDSATITAKTDVFTASSGNWGGTLFIDQATDALYVSWKTGNIDVTNDVVYVISTDGGGTWGAQVIYQDTQDDIRWVRVAPMSHPDGGKFLLFWHNVDLALMNTNSGKGIETEEWTPPGGDSITGISAQKGQFQVLADWSGDGGFLAADEDITADVRSLHIEHIRDYQTDYMEPRSLSAILNNDDHKYSPPKGTITGLAAGVEVWVRSWYPYDDFADVDATDLDAHTPNFDSNWVWVHPVDARGFQIDNSDGAAKTDGGDAGNYFAYWEFNDKDVNISSDIEISPTGGNPGLLFRFVDSSNYLFVRLTAGSSANIDIRSVIATTETSEANGDFTWNSGETHFVHVRLHGTRIWVFIDKQEVIDTTFTNAAVDNGTKHGLLSKEPGTGNRWLTFGGFKSQFFGKITSIVPVNDPQDFRCMIEALDEFDQFDRGKLHFANTTASTAQRSDQMLAELLTAGGFVRGSQLGTGKTLLSDVDAGLKAISDTILRALQRLADEEDGHIYIDGIGNVIMEERAHRDSAPHTVSKVNVSDKNTPILMGFATLEWDDGNDGVENVMTARTKEATKAAAAAVWVHPEAHTSPDSTLQFDANETKDFIAETDSDAADGWDALVENTDYEANAAAGGGGSDISSELTVSQPDTDEYAGKHRKIRVVFGATAGFLTIFQIQADARTQDNEPSQAHEEDSTSRTSFGIRPFEIDCVFTHRADVARDAIVSRLARRKDSKTQLILVFKISTKLAMSQAIQRRVSDRVTVNYTDMGISEDFFIEGEAWDIFEGGTEIMVTWYLRGV